MNGITDHPLMQALGLAILHSVWQGILFFCLLKMVLSFVPERLSALKYRLLYTALTALTGLFCYTFITEWQNAVSVWKYAGEVAIAAQPVDGVISGSWQDNLFISYVNTFRRYTPVLALLYTAGLLALCFKMLRELLQVRYLRRQVMLPDSFLEQRFIELKEQSGIRRTVLLRLSEKVQVPLMLGHLKPVVLLPLSLMSRLDTQQVEAVLLHELAHIRRHDYSWNILQMIMETILFFNPVAWWLSGLIREEREHCCDDYVLRSTQRSLPYAHALLALEEYRVSRYAATMALAGNKRNSLLNRIKRITAMKQNKGNTQRILATVTVVVLLAAMACFATAFGQEKKQESKSVNKSYSKKVITITDDKGKTKVYKDESGDPAAMEEAMKMIPQAMEMAGEAMKGVDMEELGKTIDMAMARANTAMKEVDWQEISNTVDKAMKSVDWQEMHSTVNNAMKSVDWTEMQHSVDKAMKEAKQSMSDKDWKEVNKAMAEARAEMAKARAEMKDIDWAEIREDMQKATAEMKRSMKEAKAASKEDMERAKDEIKRSLKEAEDSKDANESDVRID